MWCVLRNAYVVNHMDGMAYVRMGNGKGVQGIEVWLNCDLDVPEVWLVTVLSDQVCW